MNLQLVCHNFTAPIPKLTSHSTFSHQFVLRSQRFQFQRKFYGFSRVYKGFPVTALNRGTVVCSSGSNSDSKAKLKHLGKDGSRVPASTIDGLEPFGGRAGSVSFYGLTHHSVEEEKLVSAPFKEDKASFFWVLGPVALISSLIVPQFFVGPAIEALIKNDVLVEIVASLSFELLFYVGLSTFLRVTDRVQRPYLQFSPKRWGLITGVKGYLTSAFFTMGFKIVAPLFLLCACWPALGLPSLAAVAPFLLSCIAQRIYETHLDKCGSSCWPVLPIIFEVYRLYQLTKAVHFVEKLMFSMRGLPESSKALERGSALVAMVVTFQILGVICLWSLITFLMRLFPSRPVAENY